MRGGAVCESALTHLLCQELLAKPKVCEDDVALGVKQHVLQLQVSVDDAQLERPRGALRTPPLTPSSPGHCSGEGSPVQEWAWGGKAI